MAHSRRLTLAAIGFLAAGLAGACAAHSVPRLPRPDPSVLETFARAETLVRTGCYQCLQDAAALYRAEAERAPEAPAAWRRLVDTLLLAAARERELGLGGGTSLQQAHDEAAKLPPPADYGLFLDVVRTTPWKAGGVAREQLDTLFATFPMVARSWHVWRSRLLASAGSDLLSQYLLYSFDCANQSRLTAAKLDPWEPPADVPPILRYRRATCGAWDRKALEALARDVPEFTEAHLFLGEVALAAGTLRTAERHLQQAVAAIPGLTAGHILLGHVYLAMEDVEAAREAYHNVAEAVPGHREALLGEAKALSYLGRSGDAVVVLDRMIQLGTWYMGEAHYWRGWNRYRLKLFDAANDDVLAARNRLPMDPQVDKLAGLVALARNEVERAEREFRAAVEHVTGRGQRDCDAGYYLASTLVMLRQWPEGASRFASAAPCYAQDETVARERVSEIAASDLPQERKARLTQAKLAQIDGLQAQQARAWFNAAVGYTNSGQPDKARPLAERAAEHPALAEQAQALLARLRSR